MYALQPGNKIKAETLKSLYDQQNLSGIEPIHALINSIKSLSKVFAKYRRNLAIDFQWAPGLLGICN